MHGPSRAQPEPAVLWTPPPDRVERAHLTSYMDWAGARAGHTFPDYDALWRWSVDDLEGFWQSIWDRYSVRSSASYDRVLDAPRMPGAHWFEGARLNYAENLLHARGDGGEAETAVLHLSELRPLERLTRGELAAAAAVLAGALRTLGVAPGERVVAYMPNIAETLIAFLACASVGAIWSSAAPELGARSVLDRFAQIEPRVLLAVDGYRYGGRDFDRMPAVQALVAGLPSLEHVVLLGYLDRGADPGALDGVIRDAGAGAARAARAPGRAGRRVAAIDAGGPRGWRWEELLALGAGAAPEFAQVPFEHPLWVLYSSGTTGLPKAIVHGHGGILVEQLKKSYLHLDLHRGDRIFWYTTTAWMMWNFLVGCLVGEAAIVLYDGSPAHPPEGSGAPRGDGRGAGGRVGDRDGRAGARAQTDLVWELAERTGMTCLGTSAGFLASAMKEDRAGAGPGERFDLSRLAAVGSTGSPLAPEAFEWVYRRLGDDLWLFSTSGGTDVCTAFVGGCPLLPVRVGELQCRALGCAVEAYDEQGRSVVDEVGELVVTAPMPSMPLYLWGDEGGDRYRESYFSSYPGVWRHGDWIRITPRGSAVIYGRSDATINRGGVRMGTSEIYRAAGALAEVLDALVVDLPEADRSRMVLFVVLRDGLALDEELSLAIASRIREDCSPRHVPDEILQVDAIPRTLSGKILEVPVKRILMGAAPAEAVSLDSLANPEALEEFLALARRRNVAST